MLLAEKTPEGEVRLTPEGTSIDLHAGQFIDRVGVALGLAFPAGAALEKLAETAAKAYPLPVWTKESQLSLSGPCTKALRAAQQGQTRRSWPWEWKRPLARALARCWAICAGSTT